MKIMNIIVEKYTVFNGICYYTFLNVGKSNNICKVLK